MVDMKAREVVAKIEANGGTKVRQAGSHARFTCPYGAHHTTVSMHTGDVPPGTLRKIERDLDPCPNYGPGWLR